MLGDSLTAGFGLSRSEALPAKLEERLRADGYAVRVVNAGVAGDTTAAGLARFDWATGDGADAVLIALGGNDLLRGLEPDISRQNLDAMIQKADARGLPVMLAGMRAPRNWGEAHRTAFDRIYADLAAAYGVALHPFLLDGVAGVPTLNQVDGIHPNTDGVAIIARALAASTATFLDQNMLGTTPQPADQQP